jgi:hypothetical protein
MNWKYFIFFTQFINSLLILEELPLLFKKLSSKDCQMSFNANIQENIQEKTSFVPNELLFNTDIKTTTYQTQTTILQNDQKQSVTVYDNIKPTNILEKSGKASYYFRVGNDRPGCPIVQTFNDGNSYGPCNNGNGVKYNGDSETKYWVAIKNAELHCGKTITINYKKKSIKLKVMDKCPSCSDYDLDMSLDALVEVTDSVESACSINTTPPIISWSFN